MPSNSCIFGCTVTGRSIHSFPIPTKDPDRFKTWVNLAGPLLEGLSDEEIFRKKRVCSIHFTLKDKNRNRRLNALAVPSLFLRGSVPIFQKEIIDIPPKSTSLNQMETCKPSTIIKSDPDTENHGCLCKNCRNDIVGFKYKCITCQDYEFCQKCEMMATHSEHCVLRIPKPLEYKEEVSQKFQHIIKPEPEKVPVIKMGSRSRECSADGPIQGDISLSDNIKKEEFKDTGEQPVTIQTNKKRTAEKDMEGDSKRMCGAAPEIEFPDVKFDFDTQDSNIDVKEEMCEDGDEDEDFISDDEFNTNDEVQADNTVINWTTQISPPVLAEFDESLSGLSPTLTLNSATTELEFFELFCDKVLVQKIANFTNKYHQNYVTHTDVKIYSRLHKWQDVSVEDIYIFLAITMLFTRNRRISIEEHWSTDPLLHSSVFHNTMYRNRYCSILTMLSFYEESASATNTSRLHKIKILVDYARDKFKSTFVPGRKLCIDESIVPFKGRLIIKQYSPKKRNKFGIKLCVLCDVETGYIVDFIVYCELQTEIEIVPHLGLSGSVVTELLKDYFYCNRELYVHNWYSSPQLFLYLKERATFACGTVRPNRKGMPAFQKLKHGQMATYASPPLLALKWQDKKPVLMLSTLHDDSIVPSESTDYATGRPKLKPQCVVDYTKNMGSVDTSDMMTSALDLIRKSNKWYKKLGFHIIDMFLLNAFSLYKFVKNNKKINLADFQLNVIRQLIEKYKKPVVIQPSTSRGVLDPCRFLHKDSLEHFPVRTEKGKSQRCRMCAARKKRSYTSFMCKKCNVYLCIEPCAAEYHETA